jgi:hypothetical protein
LTRVAYLALYDEVAVHVAAVCRTLDMPCDASAVQAATFSIAKAEGIV